MRLIFRWIPRIILCFIILFAFVGVVAYLINKSGELPSVEKAPWAIQTFSNDEHQIPCRVYYATEIEIIDGTPTVQEYWSYDGDRYKRHKELKEFPQDVYGNVGIMRRE